MSEAIEPLIKRKIFASEEEAIRELLKGYILQQITTRPREIARLERNYACASSSLASISVSDQLCWRAVICL